jgi:hypothetical protein
MRTLGVVAAVLLLAGCGRQGSKPAPPPGGQKDYRALLDHARKRQSANAALQTITEAIYKCQVDLGRSPKDLPELVRLGYLSELPPAPDGAALYYDAALGNVSLVATTQVPAGVSSPRL